MKIPARNTYTWPPDSSFSDSTSLSCGILRYLDAPGASASDRLAHERQSAFTVGGLLAKE